MMSSYPLLSPLGWACLSNPLEVVPFNDIGPHVSGRDCRCQPEVDDYDVVVHNAWDGREAFIEGKRKPS